MGAISNKKARGFTLIELMIVVVIIGILAAMAISRFSEAAKKAKVSETSTVLKNLWVCAETYYTEYGEWPTVSNTKWINDGWSAIGFDAPGGKTRFCYAYTNNVAVGDYDDVIAAATGEAHQDLVPLQEPDATLEAVRVYLLRDGRILLSYDYGATRKQWW